ncbi:MAG: hypothetical protein GWN32_01155 [Gemmatimonadetes bacterium]|nr:hypothetical protein [Gemmatimonadota bacterium]
MSEKVREYEGRDIAVKFDLRRCIHAEECVHGLPDVFDRDRRPWVNPDGADADRIAEVVMRCPTGALQFERRDGGPAEPVPDENVVRAEPDGPLYVRGDVEIVDSDGTIVLGDTRVAFCRCGASNNKPFCDNAHLDSGFKHPGSLPDQPPADQELMAGEKLRVTPRPNGSLLLEGPFVVRAADGVAEVKRMKVSLCRCGASQKKPFCDGSHKAIGFTAE